LLFHIPIERLLGLVGSLGCHFAFGRRRHHQMGEDDFGSWLDIKAPESLYNFFGRLGTVECHENHV
jgi:hypothetical protein